jgi:hypothetical protein
MSYAFCSPCVGALPGAAASNMAKGRKAMSRNSIYKWAGWVVAGVLAIQIYFVKEILAAEVLFAVVFAGLLLAFIAFYVVSALGSGAIRRLESFAHSAAPAMQRGADYFAHISKKPFRHPHSESAR